MAAAETQVVVPFAPDELAGIWDAATRCKLPLAEYIRLSALGITFGAGAVNRRESQRVLANAARSRR